MKLPGRKKRCYRGMAMLVVLFIVMAIAVISSGFIARSDAAMLSGYNFSLRSETDALGWGGIEHARALVISPENTVPLTTWSQTGLQLDADSSLFYDLTIGNPATTANADPNLPSTYVYPVRCSAYKQKGGRIMSRSILDGTLYFDPGSSQAYYTSLRRQ